MADLKLRTSVALLAFVSSGACATEPPRDGDAGTAPESTASASAQSTARTATASSNASAAPSASAPLFATAALDKPALEAFLRDRNELLTVKILRDWFALRAACSFDADGSLGKPCYHEDELELLLHPPVKSWRPLLKEAIRHLQHSSPAVRMEAAHLVARLALDATERLMLATAARAETEPAVAAAILAAARGVTRAKEPYSAVDTELLRWALASPALEVRGTALGCLLLAEATPPAALFDLVRGLALRSTEKKEASFACEALGVFHDDLALATFDEVLASESWAEVGSGCVAGALRMWTGKPYPEVPSPKAYAWFTKRLEDKATPLPSMLRLGALAAAADWLADDAWKSWHEKVKPFFDRAKLASMLERIVLDVKRGDARYGALDGLIALRDDKALERVTRALRTQRDEASADLLKKAEFAARRQ
ncbi:MAG: hypothetical protein U0271_26810 [Polyangiaceae bacterium]